MEHRAHAEEPGLVVGQSQASDTGGFVLAPPAETLSPLGRPAARAWADPDRRDRAGFWVRVVAFAVDLSVLGGFFLLLLPFGLLTVSIGAGQSSLTPTAALPVSLFSLCQVAGLTAAAAYFTILHSEEGQTIGKRLVGITVLTLSGEPPSHSQALTRCLAYGISAFCFGLGFLWVGLNPGKRGWHDLLAGTVVVTGKHREEE